MFFFRFAKENSEGSDFGLLVQCGNHPYFLMADSRTHFFRTAKDFSVFGYSKANPMNFLDSLVTYSRNRSGILNDQTKYAGISYWQFQIHAPTSSNLLGKGGSEDAIRLWKVEEYLSKIGEIFMPSKKIVLEDIFQEGPRYING